MILNIVSFRNCSLDRNLAIRTNEPINLEGLVKHGKSDIVTVTDVTTNVSIQFRPEDVLYIQRTEDTESIFVKKDINTKNPKSKKSKGVANIKTVEED